jgi:hypothetical protein
MAAPESRDDTEASRRGSSTRKTAVLLALRCYGRELSRLRRVAFPALLLPALGDICLGVIPKRIATATSEGPWVPASTACTACQQWRVGNWRGGLDQQ